MSNISVERQLSVFVPCANGGAGEVIEISGPVHLVASITLDGSGGFHEHILFNPQGVSGVGLTTGLKYQGVGQEQMDVNETVGVTHTFLYVFDMIGQGPGNNLRIHETFHFTVNADGTLTAYVDNPFITCQ
ncbi:MAG TPA: hypothetical protein VGR57_19235 [Ktedonobacterales bacterium]|nr:hypothetical protein [Ktedonobacterales bacterium]